MIFNAFYKKFGVRRAGDLIDPPVVKNDSFNFPINTMLHWTMVSDIVVPIKKEYGYLSNLKTPSVITVTEYKHTDIKGKVTLKPFSVTKLMKELRKNAPSFKFYKPGTKKIKVPSTKTLIFNYGVLNSVYKYAIDPMNDYYKFYNNFKTLLSYNTNDIVGNNRNKFILIDVPENIPSRMILDKYVKELTKIGLDHFNSYKHLIILELWRLLSNEKSIFDIIPEEEYYNITLMFNINGNVSFLNMRTLMSLSEDRPNVITKLNKVKTDTLKKMFFIYINKLLNTKNVEVELNNNMVSNDYQLEDDEKHDLDKLIDNNLDDVDEENNIEKIVNDNISDSELEKATLLTKEYKTVDEVLKDTHDGYSDNLSRLEMLKSNKLITTAKYNSLKESLDKQKNVKIDIPGMGKVTLKELLTIEKEDLTISDDEIKLPDDVSVIDKSMNKDILNVYDKKYIEKVYKKDIANVIFSLQNNGIIIDDYKVEESKSILGGMEVHTINMKLLDGSTSKISFKLPVIDKNGTFTLSKNTYKIRKQKVDLPIKKITFNRVALSTYYGKVNITKATYKKDDLGFYIKNNLVKMFSNGEIKSISVLPNDLQDIVVPYTYSVFARYIQEVVTLDGYYFNFNYKKRDSILKDIDLKKIEGKKTLVGKKGKEPILMDNKGILYIKDKSIGNIYEVLKLDTDKLPVEFTNVKIFKTYIPVVVILSFYLGLDNLFKLLKTKYEKVESGKRVTIGDEHFVVKFKDYKLVIEKDHGLSDIIIAGLNSIKNTIKNIKLSILNNKDDFNLLFNELGLSISYINEIKLLENMYVDPISAEILKEINEPVTFKGLLIRSSELLIDDNYKNPNNVQDMLIKGYERIPGMLYSELVVANRIHMNKSFFGKSKINISPYSVLSKIQDDSSTVLVDDLNPVSMIKQYEDVVSTGMFGRNKDTFTKDTRSIDPSEIGIFSEATKDSGDVGISAYLTAAPKLKNVRGMVDDYDFKKDGTGSLLSTAGLLAPMNTHDDPKRANFTNIMSSHVIPILNSEVPYVRTGYENVLAKRCDPKFAVVALDDGTVTNVTPTTVTVAYKDKKETYKIMKWTSKEEAGSAYTHKQISNVKKGDKVKAGDTLIYDPLFFEKDIFNPKRVLYKTAASLNITLFEDIETYEDSCVITNKISKKMGIEVTKIRTFVLDSIDDIENLVKVGDKLDADDKLFTIIDHSVSAMKNIDSKTLEILKELKNSSPKSKYKGVVDDIEIFYNTDEEHGMSKTISKLIEESDKKLKSKYGYSGKVDSSYSIDGNKLTVGKIVIKIYLIVKENMGTGDKVIISNQLKSTIGNVLETSPVATGSNDEIDILFSLQSISARIVNSFTAIGTTSKVLELVGKEAIKLYNK